MGHDPNTPSILKTLLALALLIVYIFRYILGFSRLGFFLTGISIISLDVYLWVTWVYGWVPNTLILFVGLVLLFAAIHGKEFTKK